MDGKDMKIRDKNSMPKKIILDFVMYSPPAPSLLRKDGVRSHHDIDS